MTAHQSPEMLAQIVFDALQGAGSQGLSFNDLLDETDLTPSQLRRGIGVLRESLADLKNSDAVFTYEPGTNVYRTIYIPEIAESYEIMRIRGESTRSYRVLTGTVLPHARQSRAKQLRMLRRHLQLVVEETNDILEPS